jgi:molybdate transport system substrate-binding protein
MKQIIIKTLIVVGLISSSFGATKKPTLIFYCGITMVKPIKEMAKIIEQKHNCTIEILQGGSQDLYDSLKFNKVGDMYLPGSSSYRTKNIKDGFLLDFVDIGYNQASIFVAKGNPLKIKGLDDFLNEDFGIILADPNSGSIGKMTKKILIKYKGEKFFDNVYDNTVEIVTDSRNINLALKEKRTDLTINWKATASWNENSQYIDTVSLDEKYAPKKKLQINLLSFSKHKDIAKAFMKYAISKDGQNIMKKYGFKD